MEIVDAQQLPVSEMQSLEFDLVLAASGYEQRARHLAELIGPRRSRAVALGFTDRKLRSRVANDRVFKRLGYSLLDVEGLDGSTIRGIIHEVVNATHSDLRIVLDYTSMTRVWYATAIETLRDLNSRGTRVEVFLVYTPSKFSPPKESTANVEIGPLQGFCRLQLPTHKTALVVGLGYEAHRASGLVDYVEAAETYAFLADPALDPRFVSCVERNNSDLLKRLGSEHVIRYPLGDLRATEASLSSLCLGLASSYRIILAPLGPKPFSMICLLFAVKFPVVDVWRVSSGERANVYNRAPLGDPVVLRVIFS
jgi:hypothetical protein